MKRVFIALGVAGFLAGALVLPTASAGPLEDQFFKMDKSRDGSISRSEYMAFETANGTTERRATFVFDNMKGDNNTVSLDEYRSGVAATGGEPTRLQRAQSSTTRSRSSAGTERTRRRTSGGGGS